MPAYLERMPAGIPGDVTRKADSHLEPGVIGASAVNHGAPVKVSSGKLVAIGSGDAAAVLHGFLVRPYPTQSSVNDLGGGSAPADSVRDVLRRGYMSVLLASGSAAKDGQVYMRVTAAQGKAVGDIEATADPAVKSIAGAAGSGNTGNGTIGTLSVAAKAKVGAHAVVFTAATAFTVTDPDGLPMGSGATGTAFSAGGVTFTITAGTEVFVEGDTFTVTVAEAAAGNVAVPAQFMGPADADGNVEIAYNI